MWRKVLWARIMLNFWLLHPKNFLRYCEYEESDKIGTTLVAAVTGSIWKNNIKIVKVFYGEERK